MTTYICNDCEAVHGYQTFGCDACGGFVYYIQHAQLDIFGGETLLPIEGEQIQLELEGLE